MALHDEYLSLLDGHWAITLAAFFLLYTLYSGIRNYFFLSGFEGPFLARFSNIWFLWDTNTDLTKPATRHLHEKYGSVVRIGPKSLSFSTPEAARDIYYGVGRDWVKSDQYHVLATISRGLVDDVLISSTNKTWHDNLRRVMNPSFSMAWIGRYEPIMDAKIDILLEQLQTRFVDNPKADICNVYPWFTYFATDVISAIIYGQAYDDLVHGKDGHNILGGLADDMLYAQRIMPMPILDKFLRKNPVLTWLDKAGLRSSKASHGAAVAQDLQSARMREHAYKTDESSDSNVQQPILMDYFINAKNEHPDIVNDMEILKFGLNVVFAGGDTTGITLTAFFYYVLKSPAIHQKLLSEIDALSQTKNGRLSYHEAQKLPYMDACIRETFRVHPALRMTSNRVVAPRGATINGHFVPGGTVVGVNPWVVHANTDFFGDDALIFRPERWLDDGKKARRMYQALLHFGAGNFNCIGKNIAYQEIYKLVPAMLVKFDMQLAELEKDWKIGPSALAKPEKLEVRLRLR
ncbi:cytochrome P450 [Saccharata proteae CBS 121410]|uniref:Cytochrome P450 n=1 Tax=Saccharata proteae CBS 121410 TaxID=1314787 RepID=A0A9P4HTN4_9PEZI|nr:cytochrome P450 [Saccharata proteae CBS 121410]